MSDSATHERPSTNGSGPALPDQVDVAIVGSGFAGIGMAIELMRAGRTDFVVLERDGDVGGTWHENTYPGCQCDVPSNLYSFSFAPNPDWSQTFALQPEIGAYLKQVADDFGVRPHVRTGTAVTDAAWDDDGAALDRSDQPRHAHRAGPRRRHGRAQRAALSRRSPAPRASRARPSTPPAGAMTST